MNEEGQGALRLSGIQRKGFSLVSGGEPAERLCTHLEAISLGELHQQLSRVRDRLSA